MKYFSATVINEDVHICGTGVSIIRVYLNEKALSQDHYAVREMSDSTIVVVPRPHQVLGVIDEYRIYVLASKGTSTITYAVEISASGIGVQSEEVATPI